MSDRPIVVVNGNIVGTLLLPNGGPISDTPGGAVTLGDALVVIPKKPGEIGWRTLDVFGWQHEAHVHVQMIWEAQASLCMDYHEARKRIRGQLGVDKIMLAPAGAIR